MLAGALESHWNSLKDDEEYKKEINADPTVFRMRSLSTGPSFSYVLEFIVVAIVNVVIVAILILD